jgi:hypothetical protein
MGWIPEDDVGAGGRDGGDEEDGEEVVCVHDHLVVEVPGWVCVVMGTVLDGGVEREQSLLITSLFATRFNKLSPTTILYTTSSWSTSIHIDPRLSFVQGILPSSQPTSPSLKQPAIGAAD